MGAYARGGGPFILNDSPDLPERLLTRLGYLDPILNSDVDEAIFVFCNIGQNKMALRGVGFSATDPVTTRAKIAELRKVFLSSSVHGNWQLPYAGGWIRKLLHSRRLLTSRDSPNAEVLDAMQRYVKQQ